MTKKIVLVLTMASLIGLLAFNYFVYAQEPLPRKTYPKSLFKATNTLRPLWFTDQQGVIFPYSSYGSNEFFYPPYHSESDRFGFGKTSTNDTSSLNAGWYIDWGANINPAHPGGVEYARTIYFNVSTPRSICASPPDYNDGAPQPATSIDQVTANYTGTVLIDNVKANPGALWLIGNEFDAVYNGSPIKAELYAELYHYFYTTIKTADPTAKVAIGGVSQPSPLRMEYLDKVLNYYQQKYGEKFPTDLWNIHFYYMNEMYFDDSHPTGECEWGAGLPPFATNTNLAWSITVDEFNQGVPLDLQKLETNLRNFRQWMYDWGYQNTPLIITEYGILATPDFGGPYTNENAALFLRNTVNMFRTTTNVSIGYPADGYRLVQMWNWFSTYHTGFGGNLFDVNGNISVIGQVFKDEAQSLFTPYVDLQLITDSISHTNSRINIESYARNRGNTTAGNVRADIRLVDVTSGQTVGEKTNFLGDIYRRYQEAPILVAHTWEITTPQSSVVPYNLTISVSGSSDVNVNNNTYTVQFDWSPVVNMVISETVFSVGNPYKFINPVTTTITTTIINRGNLTSTATTADVIANNSNILAANVPIPSLAPMEAYKITVTKYITSMTPLKVRVKLNSVENVDLEPSATQLETSLLFEQVYLPLVLR